MVEHLSSIYEAQILTHRTILKENGMVSHGRGKSQAHHFLQALQTTCHHPLNVHTMQGPCTCYMQYPLPFHIHMAAHVGHLTKYYITPQNLSSSSIFCELQCYISKCYAMNYCAWSPRTLGLSSLLLWPQFS